MLKPVRWLEAPTMHGNMRDLFRIQYFSFLFLQLISLVLVVRAGADLSVASERWEKLLIKYVSEEGLVRYKEWQNNPEDMTALSEYIQYLYHVEVDLEANNDEVLTLLLNAYNAFCVSEILNRYPVETIQSIPKFFTDKKYGVGGEKFSLNEIEQQVRTFGDYRVHAAFACGARSAPPFRSEAYQAKKVEIQLDDQMRRWLSRVDLNNVDPSPGEVSISKIFSWYKQDFGTSDDAIKKVLEQFGPVEWKEALGRGEYRVAYREYDWSLNDARTG